MSCEQLANKIQHALSTVLRPSCFRTICLLPRSTNSSTLSTLIHWSARPVPCLSMKLPVNATTSASSRLWYPSQATTWIGLVYPTPSKAVSVSASGTTYSKTTPPPHLPPQVAIRQTYPHDYWTIGSQLLSRLVPPALGTLRASRCPESAFQLLFFGQTPHILERDTFY